MRNFVIISAICCLLTACGGKDATDAVAPAVPRRHAYPRIELPDSAFAYVEGDVSGLSVAVNKAATAELRRADNDKSSFIDVDYPQLNSRIYFTITPVDAATVGDVIANRMERVNLNLGGADAELIEFDSPAGFENKVITARGDISTPVQFIATDGSSAVVSGVAFVRDASPATADSIAPVVEMLRRDVIHALKTLRR